MSVVVASVEDVSISFFVQPPFFFSSSQGCILDRVSHSSSSNQCHSSIQCHSKHILFSIKNTNFEFNSGTELNNREFNKRAKLNHTDLNSHNDPNNRTEPNIHAKPNNLTECDNFTEPKPTKPEDANCNSVVACNIGANNSH